MSAKHTPGPWRAATRRGSWDWLVCSASDPSIEICQMFHDNTYLNEIGEANSHLVAAAPAYDAAARTLARYRDAGEEIPEAAWQQLYDAIAQATGTP